MSDQVENQNVDFLMTRFKCLKGAHQFGKYSNLLSVPEHLYSDEFIVAIHLFQNFSLARDLEGIIKKASRTKSNINPHIPHTGIFL